MTTDADALSSADSAAQSDFPATEADDASSPCSRAGDFTWTVEPVDPPEVTMTVEVVEEE